jgi:hypothetical protein
VTNDERKLAVHRLCDEVRDTILARAAEWPDHWSEQEVHMIVGLSFLNICERLHRGHHA